MSEFHSILRSGICKAFYEFWLSKLKSGPLQSYQNVGGEKFKAWNLSVFRSQCTEKSFHEEQRLRYKMEWTVTDCRLGLNNSRL